MGSGNETNVYAENGLRVTIFSTGTKFRPVWIELHTLTLAATLMCSCYSLQYVLIISACKVLINEVCPIAIWKPIHAWLHAQFFSICVLWTCFTFWDSFGTRTSHSCEGLVPRLILTLQATLLSGVGTNFVLGGQGVLGGVDQNNTI